MFTGELVDLHAITIQLHQMADAGNPLPLCEGPEFVELSLGDANFLTDHTRTAAVPG